MEPESMIQRAFSLVVQQVEHRASSVQPVSDVTNASAMMVRGNGTSPNQVHRSSTRGRNALSAHTVVYKVTLLIAAISFMASLQGTEINAFTQLNRKRPLILLQICLLDWIQSSARSSLVTTNSSCCFKDTKRCWYCCWCLTCSRYSSRLFLFVRFKFVDIRLCGFGSYMSF